MISAVLAAWLMTAQVSDAKSQLKASVESIAVNRAKHAKTRVLVEDILFSANGGYAVVIFSENGEPVVLMFVYQNGEWSVMPEEFR